MQFRYSFLNCCQRDFTTSDITVSSYVIYLVDFKCLSEGICNDTTVFFHIRICNMHNITFIFLLSSLRNGLAYPILQRIYSALNARTFSSAYTELKNWKYRTQPSCK